MENNSTALPDEAKLAQEAEYAKIKELERLKQERFKNISDAIIKILVDNEVTIIELPPVIKIIDDQAHAEWYKLENKYNKTLFKDIIK